MTTVIGNNRLQGLYVSGQTSLGLGGAVKLPNYCIVLPQVYPVDSPANSCPAASLRRDYFTPWSSVSALIQAGTYYPVVSVGLRGQNSRRTAGLTSTKGSVPQGAILRLTGDAYVEVAHNDGSDHVEELPDTEATPTVGAVMGGHCFIENTLNGVMTSPPYYSTPPRFIPLANITVEDGIPFSLTTFYNSGLFSSNQQLCIPLTIVNDGGGVNQRAYFFTPDGTADSLLNPNDPVHISNALAMFSRPLMFTAPATLSEEDATTPTSAGRLILPDAGPTTQIPAFHSQRAIEILLGPISNPGFSFDSATTGLKWGDYVSIDFTIALLDTGSVVGAVADSLSITVSDNTGTFIGSEGASECGAIPAPFGSFPADFDLNSVIVVNNPGGTAGNNDANTWVQTTYRYTVRLGVAGGIAVIPVRLAPPPDVDLTPMWSISKLHQYILNSP